MTIQPSRPLTILGQDPSLRHPDGKIVTAQILVPNEQLSAGPHGYRVQVIDYDSSLHQMYVPLEPASMGTIDDPVDPFAEFAEAEAPEKVTITPRPADGLRRSEITRRKETTCRP